MNKFNNIVINKNRGWRGLAEALVMSEDHCTQMKMIFSFSQAMWDDLIYKHIIIMQDKDNYYVINFEDDGRLPKPDQQRSVLIKHFIGKIKEVNRYEKSGWSAAPAGDWSAIGHFLKNNNNHTTSDWNCIGIRVIPEI